MTEVNKFQIELVIESTDAYPYYPGIVENCTNNIIFFFFYFKKHFQFKEEDLFLLTKVVVLQVKLKPLDVLFNHLLSLQKKSSYFKNLHRSPIFCPSKTK